MNTLQNLVAACQTDETQLRQQAQALWPEQAKPLEQPRHLRYRDTRLKAGCR